MDIYLKKFALSVICIKTILFFLTTEGVFNIIPICGILIINIICVCVCVHRIQTGCCIGLCVESLLGGEDHDCATRYSSCVMSQKSM